jgi:transcriptional regulator with XRE-family HTH domain
MRQRQGLSDVAFARRCRLSQLKLLRIENGEVNLVLHTLVRISRRLGLTASRLLRGLN